MTFYLCFYIIRVDINESIRKGKKTMQIQVKDNSRNGKIIVRNLNAQRKVERQLNEILARIKKTNEELRSI